ncbi:hypothetical protein [Sunxiuqinia sp. sy24]|uniref:hypothetical protein n=1 Tax=Sunxiuqinia sp. sy24 TaxID=3461495 RepID=UPI004046036F
MRKFVSFEIEGATPIDYRYLHDEDMDYALKENESFKNSNIYFFCKVKKRRFDLSRTNIINSNELRTAVVVNGKSFNIQVYIHELISLLQNLPDFIRHSFKIELNFATSTNTHLIFILRSEIIGDENIQVRLSILDLEHRFNLNLNNYPEVVYIGQSFRILDRVREHKTLSKAISRLNDDEEVILYFINFKYGICDKGELNLNMCDLMLETENRISKEYRDKISLAERFLIYLFKPIYNDQHVNTELSKDSLVKKILISSNIAMIALCYEMHGYIYRFWSPNQRLEAELVCYDFENPQLGFHQNDVI